MGTQGTQLGQPMGPHMNPQMQYQMGPQMRPKMGPHANPQMELQIGAFPSNVQLGHQFPKQHQKVIDQQRKLAEEQLKKQEELKKKKQYEAEKRRLQQTFSAKKPSNADALNSLFGKNKKGGGSSMTDLIGSLGSETSTKPAASKPSSVCKCAEHSLQSTCTVILQSNRSSIPLKSELTMFILAKLIFSFISVTCSSDK